MKKLFVSLLFVSLWIFTSAQVPQGFNYQAIARDGQGNLLGEQNLTVRVSIIQDGNKVWSEDHAVSTNETGLFSLVIGDEEVFGSGSAGSFALIDWESGTFTLGVEINQGNGFADLGEFPLQSVPFAMYAADGPGVEAQDLMISENTLSLSDDPTPEGIDLRPVISNISGWNREVDSVVTYNYVGVGTNMTNRTSLSVQGLNNEPEVPLFEVRREDGVPVFAVFNDGVMVYVDEDSKAVKGGFAVGGYQRGSKGVTQEYMRVTPDSVRIYVPEGTQQKGVKGGFAVGGYSKASKGPLHDLMYVTTDSIRLYVPDKENDMGYVGLQGGFAVETFNTELEEDQPREYIMGMNRGITRFNTADNRNGFAIGSQGEGWGSTYLQVTPVNTFLGFESGVNTRNNPDAWNANQGSRNLFLGYKSGQNNMYGHHNVFLGYQSGLELEGDSLDEMSGAYNILIGPNSGRTLAEGAANIFLGRSAGEHVTSGEGNIFVGEFAGRQSAESSGNIAIGNSAGSKIGNSNNVMIGTGAGSNNVSGASNVLIGANAGLNSAGSRNVFIGSFAGYEEEGNDKLYIDNSSSSNPLIFGDFNNDLLKFNAEVGINADPGNYRLRVEETRPSHSYAAIFAKNEISNNGVGVGVEGYGGQFGVMGVSQISGTGYRYGTYGLAVGGTYNYGLYGSASGGIAYAVYAAGDLAYTGGLIAASDQKFKKDIGALNSIMENLMKVQPRLYTVGGSEAKSVGLEEKSQYGFVAQELEKIFPELVVEVVHPKTDDPGQAKASGNPQTYKGIKYLEMIPILLKGLQEQQEEIEMLRSRIEVLEGQQ
ncbi:MAG: tail fiber domain-containing protein [Bacteroidales bacterium]